MIDHEHEGAVVSRCTIGIAITVELCCGQINELRIRPEIKTFYNASNLDRATNPAIVVRAIDIQTNGRNIVATEIQIAGTVLNNNRSSGSSEGEINVVLLFFSQRCCGVHGIRVNECVGRHFNANALPVQLQRGVVIVQCEGERIGRGTGHNG